MIGTQSSAKLPEPWLRGPITGIHPMIAPLLFSFVMVREDLATWTEPLTTGQLWARPLGLGSVGFHIRHIGGSSERLATYLQGEQLNANQIFEMKSEMDPGASREELLRRMEEQLLHVESVVKAIDPGAWNSTRAVGRKALPTTVGGLILHIAEHAQRHTGQAIITAKVVQSTPDLASTNRSALGGQDKSGVCS